MMSPESGAGCPELATAKRTLGNGTLLQPSSETGQVVRCSSGMAAPEEAEGEGKHWHHTLPQHWLCQGAPQERAQGSPIWKRRSDQDQTSSSLRVGWGCGVCSDRVRGVGEGSWPGRDLIGQCSFAQAKFPIKSQLKEGLHLLMVCLNSSKVSHSRFLPLLQGTW